MIMFNKKPKKLNNNQHDTNTMCSNPTYCDGKNTTQHKKP